MVYTDTWFWCPRCERAFTPAPSVANRCPECHEDRGIPWEEARTLHEEFPEVPAFDGKHYPERHEEPED